MQAEARLGNCLLAFYLFYREGGIVLTVRSESHPAIPHFVWAPSVDSPWVVSFEPVRRVYGWRALLRCPLFIGRWVVRPKALLQKQSECHPSKQPPSWRQ